MSKSLLRLHMERSRQRRAWIFGRLAEIGFGALMMIFGKTEIKDRTWRGAVALYEQHKWDPLDSAIEGMEDIHRAKLQRELFRPLAVDAAELLAEASSIDPLMLEMFDRA